MALIDQLFNNQEATVIKTMPQFNIEEEDQLYWWRSENELFLVGSAYYAIVEDFIYCSNLRVESV